MSLAVGNWGEFPCLLSLWNRLVLVCFFNEVAVVSFRLPVELIDYLDGWEMGATHSPGLSASFHARVCNCFESTFSSQFSSKFGFDGE